MRQPEHHDRMQAYLARAKTIIDENGWLIQGVFGTKQGDIDFAYTVGLTAKNLPELIMSGMPINYMQAWLNLFAERHIAEALQPGQLVHTENKKSMLVIDAPVAPLGMGRRLYPACHAYQLVWPDNDGHWPTQPGYGAPNQELFGPFTPPERP